MSTFPLPFIPTETWHKRPGGPGTHFGAPRNYTDQKTGKNAVLIHGACDLVAPVNTPIYAIEDGYIIRGPYEFLGTCSKEHPKETYAIDVQHLRFIARYGEISPRLPPGVQAGKKVKQGQTIAYVGDQCGNTMLHLELFEDRDRTDEYLSNENNHSDYYFVPPADYQRRNDLLDPTDYLDRWEEDLKMRLTVERAEKFNPLLEKGGPEFQQVLKNQYKVLHGGGSFQPRTNADGASFTD
jgi:murein DD-endopeptidase MepM/ murein hydrolase activator NlpD